MANFTEERIAEIFSPHLQEGEVIKHVAFGVKQPHLGLIIFLMCLAILPGIIGTLLLTKNYLIATTDKRFIVLHIKGFSKPQIKEIIEYGYQELHEAQVKTSTGAIFTHINIDIPEKKFVAKFHRAYSSYNRPNAIAIGEAISAKQPA